MATTRLDRSRPKLPRVCAQCGAPATTTKALTWTAREPAYRLILVSGIVLGLLIATWMMVKVRPTVPHELPAPVAFLGLFLAGFMPVWVVSSLTAKHAGVLAVPTCDAHQDTVLQAVSVKSADDRFLHVAGLSSALQEATAAASAS